MAETGRAYMRGLRQRNGIAHGAQGQQGWGRSFGAVLGILNARQLCRCRIAMSPSERTRPGLDILRATMEYADLPRADMLAQYSPHFFDRLGVPLG
jgi:hypothetical protein